MKSLRFHYHMSLNFDTEISNHRFTLKCIPKTEDRQEIVGLNVDIYPNEFINHNSDSFGNVSITGYTESAHDKFYVDVTGLAITGKDVPPTQQKMHKVGFHKYHTAVTKAGECLKHYFSTLELRDNMSNSEKAMHIMQRLSSDFIYETGATSLDTSAEEALKLGRGVCQDYSHIMISLCQLAHIPSRYIVGMLEGEGYSHAWVEVFTLDSEDSGHWLGIDPTNRQLVDDRYVKISCGRDYTDCLINQGLFTGGGEQRQNIFVIVYEVTDKEKAETI